MAETRRRQRVPEVHYVIEDGWLVRHTHDVELATWLTRHHVVRVERWSAEAARASIRPETARQDWYRVTPCLPNSYGAGEGWAFQYTVAEPGGRGAFPVVEWWLG